MTIFHYLNGLRTIRIKIFCLYFITIYYNYGIAQVLGYYPDRKTEVSEVNYRFGCRVLEETYSAIESDKGNITYIDLWNIAYAYRVLHQDSNSIKSILQRSKEIDQYGFSLLFSNRKVNYENWKCCFNEEEFKLLKKESLRTIDSLKSEVNNKENNETLGLNSNLLRIIKQIGFTDQKFRHSSRLNLKLQSDIDKTNLKLIDSLYQIHGKYIGKSLVGETNSSIMWSVIQHSNIESMTKYLPVITQAVREEELHSTPLKMLLDRIYTIRDKHQIFGSQSGVPLATDSVIMMVRKKYHL